jgi:Flp pilus assembly protein TadD
MNDTLGWIHVQRREHDQALPFLAAAAARAPANPTYHYHLGVALRQNGDRGKARQELQRAMASKQPFRDREKAAQALAGL